jgi:hypothetical protein
MDEVFCRQVEAGNSRLKIGFGFRRDERFRMMVPFLALGFVELPVSIAGDSFVAPDSPAAPSRRN